MNCACGQSVFRATKHNFPGSPYSVCSSCGLLYQADPPPKKFEADEEKGEDGRSRGKKMSENDRGIVELLANRWYQKHLRPICAQPYLLDMGCKYPLFSHYLRKLGCEAYGLDALDQDTPEKTAITEEFQQELQVPILRVDFEKITAQEILDMAKTPAFHGISLIHVFEHIYKPTEGLKLINDLLAPGGKVFMRMPDIETEGFEMHLSPRHYQVHPYYYSERAFREILKKSEIPLAIYETYQIGGGCRDYLLQKK
jgi:2-polyprenyl-3-methyl-5-hydroxy-6-metoxy-1,4-benzoquinol methylase